MRRYIALLLCLLIGCLEAKAPDLTPADVTAKAKEIMKAHASYKKLTPILAQRILNNYLDLLDPTKTYFIESDIQQWTHPSDQLLNQLIEDYNSDNFRIFEDIQAALVKAIQRRRLLEQKIDYNNLPTHVTAEEFKDMAWAKSEEELVERLRRIRALQLETSAKLSENMKENAMQRIAKRQAKFEEEQLAPNPEKEHLILSNVLKATASALDSHTAYFTPTEATQFMINVQQRLFGIGAQLRDDINGFTVIKIVEGGPAALGKQLKAKDRIVAVNGEPVVGMDISDAVDLIRGEEHTPVVLTVIRETPAPDGTKKEEKLDITISRGEVVLKETRFKSSYEPFGEGVIGYLKLYSFYQDRDSSSATDLEHEINKLKKDHHLLGLILDLRYNSGGLLSQAVAVTGLFITKGVVVSIKDENGRIQHLRDLDGTMAWDGPLIVLVNRMSASASEIVAQTLQDYGRALIIGDDHTYGKGSYQTFTLTTSDNEQVNPQGEYKVTRGRYYTVSGQTPQLTGVLSDVAVPGPLSESDIGERFAKYPLENDHIKSNFDDDLSDIPFLQREKIRKLYKFGLQEKLDTYRPYLERLKTNSQQRLAQNLNYQNMLKEIKKKDEAETDEQEDFGQNDLQLEESYNIMEDLLLMMQDKGALFSPQKKESLSSVPFDPLLQKAS
ncbi:S41 family peptidase [Candidatus Protochlamydia phocaeensis]|uniref:tail-specific protease Tsp n=1 Tax=Candidatus Protochlamydia phocaeensis TaxID=1414722 RepID=UPI0008385229|nr:S41 family peptidase [Candidatus Protochlamydia phocaeensis]